MSYTIDQTVLHGNWYTVHILGEATAAMCLCNIPNPEAVDVLVLRAYLYIETAALAASTVHMGFGASGVDVHDIVDGFAFNNAAGSAWQWINQGANAHTTDLQIAAPVGHVWLTTEFLTITTAAQVSTGLDAYLFIEYIRLP